MLLVFECSEFITVLHLETGEMAIWDEWVGKKRPMAHQYGRSYDSWCPEITPNMGNHPVPVGTTHRWQPSRIVTRNPQAGPAGQGEFPR